MLATHRIFVRAFWIACATLHGLSFIVNLGAWFARRGETSLERKYVCGMMFCNFCFVILGSLEGSATQAGEHSIGIDPLATALFVLGGSSYWILIELLLFLQTRLNPLPIGFQRLQWLKTAHRNSLPLQMLMSTTAFLVLFGMITDPENSYKYAAAHFLLLGCLILAVCLLLIFSVSAIIRDIRLAIKATAEQHQRLDRVLHVFLNLRVVIAMQLVCGSTLSFAFGVSPKLVRMSAYFLPLLWASTSLAFLAHGASAIAVSRHRVKIDKGGAKDRVVLSDNQQIILPRLSVSTPRSGKMMRRKRKQWKGGDLTRVDEGNMVSSTDEFPGPKAE